jgi:FMN reductase
MGVLASPIVVGISGSPSLSSKTRAVVQMLGRRIADQAGAAFQLADVAELTPVLGVRSRAEAPPPLESALRVIESADLLLVGSPVYKGSYSGLFKHLIDLVDYQALQGTPVALIATGGSDRHALAVEHQLRPLFSFFLTHTLPTGVFIPERAIVDGRIVDEAIGARLVQLVNECVRALRNAAYNP